MKTWIKRILISLVVVIVVAVVGLAIFLLTFDPNAYKDKLAELIQTRYDRTLTIGGEIELSLFPRIGLSLQDVTLSEPGSQTAFASMESARVAIAVFPLLSNNLVVDHVAVSGFKGRFQRKKDGSFNFDDLVGGPAEGTPPAIDSHGVVLGASAEGGLHLAGSEQGAGFQIDIAGLDLQQGELQLQDEITGRAVALNDLNINTGRVTFNQAFNATISAHIEGGNPRMDAQLSGQSMLLLDPAARRYTAQKLDLRLTGQIMDLNAKNFTARGNVAFSGTESALDVSGLEMLLQGELGGSSVPVKALDVSVVVPKLSAHPNRSQLQIEKLTVRATGGLQDGPFELALDAPALNISPDSAKGQALTGRLRVSGPNALDTSFSLAGISGNASELDVAEVKLDGSLKSGERLVKTNFSTPLSLDLAKRSVAMSALRGDVAITDPELPKGSLQIPVIGSLAADFTEDQAVANINAVLEGGKFDLTSKVTSLSEAPKFAFSLAVDILDLDKLVPPPSAQAQPAKAQGDTAAAPAAPVASSDDVFDFSALVGPTASGTIKIGRLVMRNIKAADVVANINLDQGKLDLTGLTASLYEGSLSGDVSLDVSKNNLVHAKLTLPGVSIEPLLIDASRGSILSGRGDVTLDLTTSGANTYALRKGLNGTAQVKLRDGAVRGFDVAGTLRDLKAAVTRAAGSQPVDAKSVGDALAGVASVAAQVAAQPTAGQTPATQAVPPAAPAPATNTRSTDFTSLDLNMVFKDGMGTAKTLNIASPLLRIAQGSPASVNLVESTLDFVALVRVVNTIEGQDGEDLADLKNLTIPVHFTGPLNKPLFSVQWQTAANAVLKQRLENRVLDAIGGKQTGAKEDTRSKMVRDVGKALEGVLKR